MIENNNYTPEQEAIEEHFFKSNEIKVGSRWIGSSGIIVTVEKVLSYPASDHEENHHYYIVYSWNENGEKKTHKKELFAFQVRYGPIIECESANPKILE